MQVFHIATESDWAQAQRSGFYLTSTRGVTLQQEGFIHASRADQWEAVRSRYYADAPEALVLLVIDTDLLTSPWREDPVTLAEGREDSFPHIYGPLNPSAVVAVVPLGSPAGMPAPPATPSGVATAPDAGTPPGSATVPPAYPIAAEHPSGTSFRREIYLEVFVRLSLVLAVMIATVVGASVSQPPVLGAAIGAGLSALIAWWVGRTFTRRRDQRLAG